MTKAELITLSAAAAGISKKDAATALNTAFAGITDAMAKGERVQLAGFGTFEVRKRAERTGKNPQTKQPIRIAACKAPAFKPGKALKDAVNAK